MTSNEFKEIIIECLVEEDLESNKRGFKLLTKEFLTNLNKKDYLEFDNFLRFLVSNDFHSYVNELRSEYIN